MKEVFIGFDSAWTDSPTNPGAISAYVMVAGCQSMFMPPFLATFERAQDFIQDIAASADYTLIAIDQPTIVPNDSGCRPVDRVAGSLISRLKGGVQPARRSGGGARMFGNEAPIWRFLNAVGAAQNPTEARQASSGRFIMEVFPALSLPAIIPEIWARGKAAKYNPARRKTFDPNDWKIVATGVAAFVRSLKLQALADWLEEQSCHENPRKADQDKLDAAICLAIALAWRSGPMSQMLLIGDERSGYIATISSAATRETLVNAATARDVWIDRPWA